MTPASGTQLRSLVSPGGVRSAPATWPAESRISRASRLTNTFSGSSPRHDPFSCAAAREAHVRSEGRSHGRGPGRAPGVMRSRSVFAFEQIHAVTTRRLPAVIGRARGWGGGAATAPRLAPLEARQRLGVALTTVRTFTAPRGQPRIRARHSPIPPAPSGQDFVRTSPHTRRERHRRRRSYVGSDVAFVDGVALMGTRRRDRSVKGGRAGGSNALFGWRLHAAARAGARRVDGDAGVWRPRCDPPPEYPSPFVRTAER